MKEKDKIRRRRDGTGPHKDSLQISKGKGKRQEAGETCPFHKTYWKPKHKGG